MAEGKLNKAAQRQQEARKKRLAEALRANMALRKNRGKAKPDPEPQTGTDESDLLDEAGKND